MGSVGLAPREGPKIVVMAPLILAIDNCIARVLSLVLILRGIEYGRMEFELAHALS